MLRLKPTLLPSKAAGRVHLALIRDNLGRLDGVDARAVAWSGIEDWLMANADTTLTRSEVMEQITQATEQVEHDVTERIALERPQDLGGWFKGLYPKMDNADIAKRIMANENASEWGTNLQVTVETVAAAKKCIENELAKYETWEEFDGASNSSIRSLLSGEQAWHKVRATCPGQTTILKFLGAPWKQHQIQPALDVIRAEEAEQRKAEEARKGVRTGGHPPLAGQEGRVSCWERCGERLQRVLEDDLHQ